MCETFHVCLEKKIFNMEKKYSGHKKKLKQGNTEDIWQLKMNSNYYT